MKSCWTIVMVGLGALAARTATAAAVCGFRADAECSVVVPETTELIGMKLTPDTLASATDVVFDMSLKGGTQSLGTMSAPDGGWNIDETWRNPQLQDDPHFVVMASRERAPGTGCVIRVDSAATGYFFMYTAPAHLVGDAPPSGQLESNGLTIPGSRDTYSVLGRTFPERLADGTTTIAFAPVPDVQPMAGADCAWGGWLTDPLDAVNVPPARGLIVGYNVYRLPACPGTAGGQQEIHASLLDGDPRTGWVGFVDLRKLLLNVADDASVSPGPSDLDPEDGVALANPDGIPYDGDEVLLFTDPASSGRPDAWRAPQPDESYWYAVQPAWRGAIEEFAAVSFTDQTRFEGDHRRDVDGDGSWDAVDLDLLTAGGVEFLSPQSNAINGSLDGLGLTAAGMPLVSKPIYAEQVDPPGVSRCVGRGPAIRRITRRR